MACTTNYHTPLCEAIIYNDVEYVRDKLDHIMDGLNPVYGNGDPIGHYDNLHIVTGELSRDDCLYASILCYACIESYPPQSEILIQIDDGEYLYEKVIDIAMPLESEMYFVGMHD